MRPSRGFLPLGGMNRNRATLPGDSEPVPDEVFNLRPHRTGGLIPIGEAVALPFFSSLTGAEFVGGDETGLFSLNLSTFVRLVEPNADGSSTSINTPVATNETREYQLHIPTIGVQNTFADWVYKAGDSVALSSNISGLLSTSVSISEIAGDLPDQGRSLLALGMIEVANGMRVIRKIQEASGTTITVGRGLRFRATDFTGGIDTWDIYVADDVSVGGFPQPGQYRYLATLRPTDTTVDYTQENQLHGSVFPTASGFGFWLLTHSVVAAIHNQRVWSVQPAGSHVSHIARPINAASVRTRGAPVEPNPGDIGGPLTLHYTEQGLVNAADPGSTLVIPARASERVTALVSSPSNEFGVFGGLLVFCDNETFVVTGDPALIDTYSLSPHALPIGCDEGVQPALLAGLIFVVWQGRLYLVDGAQAKELSQPVIRPGESFSRVVADVHTQSIVALHSDARWYRYYYLHDFWVRDPLNELLGPSAYVGWGGGHALGPFFGNTSTGDLRVVLASQSAPSPTITWLDVDFGDPAMHKKLFQARTFTSNYSGGATLAYNMHTGMDEVDEATATTLDSTWDEGDGLFRFPTGVRGKRLDFRLTLEGATDTSVLESPIEVTFTPGYRKR